MLTTWKEAELGTVVTLQRGYDLPYRMRRPGAIPVVTSTGITDHHSQARERGPGVITGRYGTIGEVFFVEEDYWPHNTTLFVKDFHGNDPLFISYLLRTIDFQSHSGKSGVPGVNRNDLHALTVRIPTETREQKAIALVLSDAEALINALCELVRKKRDLKLAVMQQLVSGHKRLRGFKGTWEQKRLADLAEIVSGGTPKTSNPSYWDGSIKWCTPTDITGCSGKYLFETQRTISAEGLASCSAHLLPAGSLLLCSRATIGEVKIAGCEICTNQGFKSLVCKPTVHNEFLYYALLTMKSQMIERAIGSTFLEISKKDTGSLRLAVPEHSEQIAIANLLSDMDAELEAWERRRDKTELLKHGMMQQLLTGKIRTLTSAVIAKPAPEELPVLRQKHNWEFNEAVVISVLAKQFGTDRFPLGRKRYTKLAYMLHRHVEREARGYLKKAAGPYNPNTKYKGPEAIAQNKHYVRRHNAGRFLGFVAADNIVEAQNYFQKWYGPKVLPWLEQFRFKKNDELELLTTVDMAVQDLLNGQSQVTLRNVKKIIRNHKEWRAKLQRPIFADAKIAAAIETCKKLFGCN